MSLKVGKALVNATKCVPLCSMWAALVRVKCRGGHKKWLFEHSVAVWHGISCCSNVSVHSLSRISPLSVWSYENWYCVVTPGRVKLELIKIDVPCLCQCFVMLVDTEVHEGIH